MKPTQFCKLVNLNSQEDVPGYLYLTGTHSRLGDIFVKFARSPRADELIAVTAGERRLLANIAVRQMQASNSIRNPWHLQIIERRYLQNTSIWIAVRTDSGPFWFALAYLKYKIWNLTALSIQRIFVKLYNAYL